MQRPPLPPRAAAEDEFFGLGLEGTPIAPVGKRPAAPGALRQHSDGEHADVASVSAESLAPLAKVLGFISTLAEKRRARRHQEEIDEIALPGATGKSEFIGDGALADSLTPLASNRDWEAFRRAEAEADLFSKYNRQIIIGQRSTTAGLALTALIYALIAGTTGSAYFDTLIESTNHPIEALVEPLGSVAARSVGFVVGCVMPLILFILSTTGFASIVSGALRRSPLHIAAGLVTVIGALLSFAALFAAAWTTAIIVAVTASAAGKIIAKIASRFGGAT